MIRVHDTASPELRDRVAQLSPQQRRAFMALAGRTVERALKDHFRARGREGNRRGFPRTHFWAREGVTKTALLAADANQAAVIVSSPAIAHKVRGGVIRPGAGKRFLAIPLTALAYGRRPSERHIPGLFFRRAGARGYLAARDASGALRVHYLLVARVVQRPDPRALPEASILEAQITARGRAWFARRDQPAP